MKKIAVRDGPGAGLMLLGDSLGRAGDAAAAVEVYRKVLERDPRDFWSCFGLAWWHMQTEKPDWSEAARLLTIASVVKPDVLGVAYLLGKALLGNGDLDGAIAVWREVYAKEPDCGRIRELLMDALSKKGSLGLESPENLEAGMRALEEALALAPEGEIPERLRHPLARCHELLGVASDKRHDLTGAIARFREALRLGPPGPATRWRLANALRRTGQVEEATPLYRDALGEDRVGELQSQLLCELAHAYLSAGDEEAAVSALRESLATDRANPCVCNDLAELLLRRGESEEAIEHLRRRCGLARRFSDHVDPVFDLARAQLEAGDVRGATETCQAFLERQEREWQDKGWLTHLRAQVSILLKCPVESLRDPERALRLAEEYGSKVREGPWNTVQEGPWHAVLGPARYASGRYEEAAESFAKLVESQAGGDFEAWDQAAYRLDLAKALHRAGRTQEALAQFRKAEEQIERFDFGSPGPTNAGAVFRAWYGTPSRSDWERLRAEAAEVLGMR